MTNNLWTPDFVWLENFRKRTRYSYFLAITQKPLYKQNKIKGKKTKLIAINIFWDFWKSLTGKVPNFLHLVEARKDFRGSGTVHYYTSTCSNFYRENLVIEEFSILRIVSKPKKWSYSIFLYSVDTQRRFNIDTTLK